LATGKGAMENMGMNSTFWLDRPVFVTGATGLVGSWLVQRLVDARADVVCLVRDWIPQSETVRTELVDCVKVVRGDLSDRNVLERALGEYEIDTVIHLAAQACDCFYVKDGAAAYMLLAEALAKRPDRKGEAFNFSNEIQITVSEIVERILGLMDSPLNPQVLNETRNEILHQYLSAEKARSMFLGWQPLFSLDEGLKQTIDWYSDFLGEI